MTLQTELLRWITGRITSKCEYRLLHNVYRMLIYDISIMIRTNISVCEKKYKPATVHHLIMSIINEISYDIQRHCYIGFFFVFDKGVPNRKISESLNRQKKKQDKNVCPFPSHYQIRTKNAQYVLCDGNGLEIVDYDINRLVAYDLNDVDSSSIRSQFNECVMNAITESDKIRQVNPYHCPFLFDIRLRHNNWYVYFDPETNKQSSTASGSDTLEADGSMIAALRILCDYHCEVRSSDGDLFLLLYQYLTIHKEENKKRMIYWRNKAGYKGDDIVFDMQGACDDMNRCGSSPDALLVTASLIGNDYIEKKAILPRINDSLIIETVHSFFRDKREIDFSNQEHFIHFKELIGTIFLLSKKKKIKNISNGNHYEVARSLKNGTNIKSWLELKTVYTKLMELMNAFRDPFHCDDNPISPMFYY
jgi:hypothetical protein